MNICSHGHDEVAHEGSNCPFCAYITEQEQEIGRLRADVKLCETEISRLEQEIEDNLEPLIATIKAANKANEDSLP